MHAARTSADQRVATAEARLAEEIQRRRDAEAERDDARADREQADGVTAQAITRMDALEHELAELGAATEAEVLSTPASATADIQQARETAARDISTTHDQARPPGRRCRRTRGIGRAGRHPSPAGRGRSRHPSRIRPGRRSRRDGPHPR